MARLKGEDKIDTHIYVRAALLRRFNAAHKALKPCPSRNALIEHIIEAWTEEQENRNG